MDLHFNSRVELLRDQALVQGMKFPGAFAYPCDLLVDSTQRLQVRRSKGSTAHSVGYRMVESVIGSRAPQAEERLYKVVALAGREPVFYLQKPERLRATITVFDGAENPLGALLPTPAAGPKFRLVDATGAVVGSAEPLLPRGLDFDFMSNNGEVCARLRLQRRPPSRVAGRLALRAATILASGGLGDMAGKDHFTLEFRDDGAALSRWFLVAAAVACSAERGMGQVVGGMANGAIAALKSAQTFARKTNDGFSE